MSRYTFLLVVASLSIISCTQHPETDPHVGFYSPESPYFVLTSDCFSGPRQDSSSISIVEGQMDADTVLLVLQGGPSVEIDPDEFNFYEQFMLVAYLQQPQTLQGFSEQDGNVPDAWVGANVDISEAASILNESILKYRQQGKKVMVMGVSWGAFIVQQWLSEYENTADKVFILVGRLYAKNLVKSFYPAYPDETVVYLNVQTNKDYRPLLGGRDLTNVYYVTALYDEAVSKLTKDEIDWLDEHGVAHYELVGGHSVIEERKGTLLLIDLMFRH